MTQNIFKLWHCKNLRSSNYIVIFCIFCSHDLSASDKTQCPRSDTSIFNSMYQNVFIFLYFWLLPYQFFRSFSNGGCANFMVTFFGFFILDFIWLLLTYVYFLVGQRRGVGISIHDDSQVI